MVGGELVNYSKILRCLFAFDLLGTSSASWGLCPYFVFVMLNQFIIDGIRNDATSFFGFSRFFSSVCCHSF